MKIKHVLVVLSAIFSTPALSQQSEIEYEVEAQAIGTTNDAVPFWMRSNKFGSIPSDGISSSFIGRAYKNYDSTKTKVFDWGGGAEIRSNLGSKSKIHLIEGYLKFKAGIFQLKGGRSKDLMGLNGDSLLTSGNFSQSGNSFGVPKLEISIPNYYRLPILDGLISLKGGFSHGWLGTLQLRDTIGGNVNTGDYILAKNTQVKTYFHQKSLYGRLGKEDWNISIYAGLNHQVFWSDGKEIYGEEYGLSPIESFLYVATGKAYGGNGKRVERSKIGNHLGSIDIGIEYDFDNIQLMIYRQNFYDVGALSKLANIKDGLTGVTLTNKKKSAILKKILLEVLYTKNQAGELNSKVTKSGDENYYNNYLYKQGWSYGRLGLGTPFITLKKDATSGNASNPIDFFINNRVFAIHNGIELSIKKWEYRSKLSYSKNYGTYGTSPIGHSIGSRRYPNTTNLFKTVNQFSAEIEGSRYMSNNLRLGFSAGLDKGSLLDDSFGLLLRISKRF